VFIAHIPVGLALGRYISRRRLGMPVVIVASFGAIFPDLDLIRFYLFDNHQRHHHDYWTHIPVVWGAIILGWFMVSKLCRRSFGILPSVFFAAVMSHLVLDSMAGAIEWLWPISDKGFSLVSVPATHTKWYLSFLAHWTFAVEIFISLAALCMALTPYGYKDPKDTGAPASKTKARRGG